jgi:hypothetical protein
MLFSFYWCANVCHASHSDRAETGSKREAPSCYFFTVYSIFKDVLERKIASIAVACNVMRLLAGSKQVLDALASD